MAMSNKRRGLRGRLLDFLSEEMPENGSREVNERADPLAAAVKRFVNHVERALGSKDTIPVGALHVVGFAKLRERVGDQWDQLQKHLHELAAKILEARLPSGSTYVPYGDSYLLVLPEMPEQEARSLCAMFANELERQLLGEENTGHIEVRSAVRMVDREEVAQNGLAERVLEDIVDGDEDKPPLPEQPIRLVYQPLMDVRKEIVSAFLCIPSRISRYGRLMLGDEALVSPSGEPDIGKLDRNSVNKAIKDLILMHEEGKKFFLVIPVHFETLAGQVSRTAYYDLCKTLPSNLRQFALYEILDFPDGVPSGRVREVASLLKHYGRAVFARTAPDAASLGAIKEGGCIGAGFDATDVGTGLGPVLQRYGAAAERASLRSFVHNVRAPAAARVAVESGFSFVGGDVVGPIAERPRNVYRLSVKTFAADEGR